MALKTINKDESVFELVTDGSWKGHLEEFKHWETLDFDDTSWEPVEVKGAAGDQPWGNAYLKNLGGSTTPYRPLSVNLTSPNIEVFNEMPEIYYDVKTESDNTIGWYRFEAPPGIQEIDLGIPNASVWVDGNKVPVEDGVAIVPDPPEDVSTVSVRLVMKKGEYAGAVFQRPLKLILQGGIIQNGEWSDFALPTYSGIGVYRQRIDFTSAEASKDIELDLGDVYATAEVKINGKTVGVKVAAPYKFDLTGLVRPGENELEIRIANTLAPQYTIPTKSVDLGPLRSGLVGPVKLMIQE